MADLVESFGQACRERCRGRRILVALDRTEYRYGHQKSRKDQPGFGKMRTGWQLGFHFQVGLAIDRDEALPLGLAEVKAWARPRNLPDKKARDYANQPQEEKESKHWLEAVKRIIRSTEGASEVSVVADCELDFFDFLSELDANRCGFVVRATHDRKLAGAGETQKTSEAIESTPQLGEYLFEVAMRKAKGRTARTARMEVRSSRVRLKPPEKARSRKVLEVGLLEVREAPDTVPKGEKPIQWRLYTSHAIDRLEECREIVAIYQNRWLIEQLFRTTKRKGMKVESSQVEKAEPLKKLICMALEASVTIMQLVQTRDEKGRVLKATLAFSQSHIALLAVILRKVNGNTKKQRNPHPTDTMAWAAWIIARLGGWSGYEKDAKPGPITMMRGLEIFGHYIEMAEMLNQNRDV